MKALAVVAVAFGLMLATAAPSLAHGYHGPVYHHHHGYAGPCYYGGYRPVVVVPAPVYYPPVVTPLAPPVVAPVVPAPTTMVCPV